MQLRTLALWLLTGQAIAFGSVATGQVPDRPTEAQQAEKTEQTELGSPQARSAPGLPSDVLLRSLDSEALRQVAAEVLERNHQIARARHLAAAAAVRAPQVRALPDPVAALTLFVLPPESRVGPQRLSASISQELPWFGKLALEEQAALYEAAAAEADVETLRLDKLLETRRLIYELAFHHIHRGIVAAERNALVRYEKVAQSHYAAGTGLQQEIVRIQAQITRIDTRLLEITEHRIHMLTALNALRDRPAETPTVEFQLPQPREPMFDPRHLNPRALEHRPELVAADAMIAAKGSMIELAEKSFRPDITLGLSFTAVTRRDDGPGRIAPPPNDGNDIIALNGSMNLPVWKRKLEAGVQEAQALRWAAEEDKKYMVTQIEASIGDLTARMPLLYRHQRLLETVLLKQAREALRSAETAYSTGKLNAMDLLDSEVVLFEVELAALRTRTDLAVAYAQLERTVAGPLPPHPSPLPQGAREPDAESGATHEH